MSNEDLFLAEITADPNNAAAKLVYADWLEERGDGRVEIIHARETLKTLSPLDSPYWDLKDRFRELRNEQEPEWLAAMQYDAVYRPMFTNLPADRGQRWRLVEEFIELWRKKPLTRRSGASSKAIHAAGKRVGMTLPRALREWYRFAGRKLTKVIHFPSLKQIEVSAELDGMPILRWPISNLKNNVWGIRSIRLQDDDPIVEDLRTGEPKGTISEFAIQSVVLGAISAKFRLMGNGSSIAQLKQLTKTCFSYAGSLAIYEGIEMIAYRSLRHGEGDMQFSEILAFRTRQAKQSIPKTIREAMTNPGQPWD